MFSQTKKVNVLLTFLLIFLIAPLFSFSQVNIEIQVSPHVLNLQNQGEVVTIHTDIAYSSVVGSTVFLDVIEIQSWKADNQGNFVAKFNMDDVIALNLTPDEYYTFTLTGVTTGGETFTGSEDILIVDRVAKGKK